MPRFFFGDSTSYLFTRIGEFVPIDRSWLYGSVINPIIDAAGSLQAVLVLQTLLGALVCTLAGALVQVVFRRTRGTGMLVTAVLSFEPLLLYYERSILTEVPALTAWVAMVTCCCLLAVRPHWGWAAAGAVAATLAVALRTAFVPPVAAAIVLLGALALSRAARRQWTAAAAAALLPVLACAALAGLGLLNGLVTRQPASLNAAGGFHLLAPVAPMLEPEDFGGLDVEDPAGMLITSRASSRQHRNAQIWGAGGIATQLKAQTDSLAEANRIASEAALHAIRRNPAELAHLVARQLADYLNVSVSRQSFPEWSGTDRSIDRGLRELLLQRTGNPPAAGAPARRSGVLSVMEATTWWPPLGLGLAISASLASLIVALVRRGPYAAPLSMISLLTLTYSVGVVGLSADTVPRYVLPVLPLLAVQTAALFGPGAGHRATVMPATAG